MFPIRDLNPTRIRPLVTVALIAINVGVFFLWQPASGSPDEFEFFYENAAVACELTTQEPISVFEVQQETCVDDDGGDQPFPDKNVLLAGFVSMFLHGGFLHIAGNMWFLWVFGNNVEEAFGSMGYLLMYLASGVAATIVFVATNPANTVPLVGASGAIAGVLGSYLVLYPTHRVLTLLFFFFVPIPAIIFLGIWFASQFGISAAEGIAWQAHVGGFVFGALITLPMREVLLRRVAALHSTARHGGVDPFAPRPF